MEYRRFCPTSRRRSLPIRRFIMSSSSSSSSVRPSGPSLDGTNVLTFRFFFLLFELTRSQLTAEQFRALLKRSR